MPRFSLKVTNKKHSLHGEDPEKGVTGPGQIRRGSYQGTEQSYPLLLSYSQNLLYFHSKNKGARLDGKETFRNSSPIPRELRLKKKRSPGYATASLLKFIK